MDQKFISNLKKIIIEAGQISINLRDKGLIVKQKKDSSPVTNADIAISNFIYAKLTEIDINIPVICEEQPLKDVSNKETIWLVDPIDGTKSYIDNMNSFTINIALISKQIPVIGLIYQPILKKLYFTNHKKKLCIEQDGYIIAPEYNFNKDYRVVVSSRNSNLETKEYIKKYNFLEVISIASSIKLCMIAEGYVDSYPRFNPTMEWDIAAGHALILASEGDIIDTINNKSLVYNKNNFQNSNFIALSKRHFRSLIL